MRVFGQQQEGAKPDQVGLSPITLTTVGPSVYLIPFSNLNRARGSYSTWLTTHQGQNTTPPAYGDALFQN